MPDWKRRAKAAAALAGTTDIALAKEFGISIATYNRRLQPQERAPEQMQAELVMLRYSRSQSTGLSLFAGSGRS